MAARESQLKIKNRLTAYFDDSVVLEWPITRGATDILARSEDRYSPRVDVAVHTIGTAPGNHLDVMMEYWNANAPERLHAVFSQMNPNINPRCVLAIEVVFSGSSKHIIGDITNASMMGLYGIVVASGKMITKVRRIKEYIRVLQGLGKAPESLFQNVCVMSEEEFLQYISP
jgi:hypothetical protein